MTYFPKYNKVWNPPNLNISQIVFAFDLYIIIIVIRKIRRYRLMNALFLTKM